MTAAAQAPAAALRSGEVHLWCLPSCQNRIDRLREDGTELLSVDEMQRLREMKQRGPADQFLLGRILLRRVLAQYLDTDSAMLSFGYDDNGKPRLARPVSCEFSFNLSHTASDTILAVGKTPAIGVDLEAWDRAETAYRISQRFFSASEHEHLELLGQAGATHALMLWALKESVVKASGDTVWDGLANVSLAIRGKHIEWLPCPEADRRSWKLAGGTFRDASFLAIAVHTTREQEGNPQIFRTYVLDGGDELESDFKPEIVSWPVETNSN